MQLWDQYFDSREALKNVIQGKHAENLIESKKIAMEGSERCVGQSLSFLVVGIGNSDGDMGEIERTLGTAASSRHHKYNIEKVEKHMLYMEQTVGTLRALGTSLGEGPIMGEGGPQDPQQRAVRLHPKGGTFAISRSP